MTPTRYFRARVSSEPDHGILHFLIEESEGRTVAHLSVIVLEAPFIRTASATASTPVTHRLQLDEIGGAVFAATQGSRIGIDELPGMSFFWIR